MASSDESILAIPRYECPDCGSAFDINRNHWIEKHSKAQRTSERCAEERPEISLVPLSCGNRSCPQYSVIKIIRIPRIKVSSTRVNLE